jgi:hypothetical protein
MFVCDLTTPAQCQSVSAAGAAKVDGSAVTQPVSGTITANIGTVATLSTAANQTSQITQETASAAALGTTADTACATDNGTCTIPALIKRTNQNVTTLNTTAAAAVPAGTNIIGKVGIDQTTPGTTNLVALGANQSVNVAQFGGTSTSTGQVAVSVAPVTATNTALVTALRPDSPGIIALGVAADTASVPVVLSPSGNATAGITPVVGGSAVSSLVLKASAGSLYNVYAECTAACWLMVFNSTTAPSNGATTAGVASGNMVECVPIASGGTGSINYNSGPPEVFSVGMTAAISSTTCATLTLATTGFIHGMVK